MPHAPYRFCLILVFALITLFNVQAQNNLIITEFMASNANGLLDENGDTSDWIEIHNSGPGPTSLEGWFLTDNRANLTKWRFPATNLSANGYLIVFASGKNRVTPGTPLHTSFNLAAAGGYLALVEPDGVTIATEYNYLEQFADISFGFGLGPSRITEPLVPLNAAFRYLIPAAPVDEAWRSPAPFDDASWSNGTMAAGYDLNPTPLNVAYAVA